MRNTTRFLISAACVFAAMPASAATFVFSSGNYVPGTTSPTPLLSPDTLDITTVANKSFNAVTFTNQSGTVNWQDGNIFLTSAAALNNQSLWNITGNNSINFGGGINSTFTNTGTFRKSAGLGNTAINTVNFVNSGTIDAQTGRIVFATNGAAFNAGSIFTGAGEVAIAVAAAFNGGFTSSNLVFENGTFTGTNAALTGTADWESGTMVGSWEIAAGATLDVTTTANKSFNAATFTNDGTINWQAGNMFLISDSKLVNNGTLTATGDNSINFGGGVNSTFTNTGTFRKSAGVGNTTISSVNFINSGTIDAQTGRIVFATNGAAFNAGSIFTGAGEVAIAVAAAFNGGFTSSNLVFESGTFTGTNAALTGTADWESGTMVGSWNTTAGSTLDVTTVANKSFNAATFTNDGTINWQAGNMFMISDSKLVNNGTMTATGDNSINFGGGVNSTFTNNGLIEKTAGSGTTTLANSGVTLDNNGTINVLSGTIALPVAFTNDGTLGGTGTFTSTNLTNGGTIAPGAAGATGTLALAGNYAQTAFGTLSSQLASTGSFDVFNISGTAGLNGTLALSCILGCAINTGDSFVLLNSVGNLSGTFSNVTTSGFLSGFTYNVIYDYAADLVRLDVINAGTIPTPGAVPEPATWLMMLFGFGLVGSTLRRRSVTGITATV